MSSRLKFASAVVLLAGCGDEYASSVLEDPVNQEENTSALVDPTAPRPGATGFEMTRAEASVLYRTLYLPSFGVPMNFTGNSAQCIAGAVDANYRKATLNRLNFARQLVRIQPVVEDPLLSIDAQAAALMMVANWSLSHYPPDTWKCYSAQGAYGASSSNLGLGMNGPDAIGAYLGDGGSGNVDVGHRRNMLDWGLASVGIGDVPGSNALFVFGRFVSPPASVKAVAWPPAGEIPWDIMPSTARWSFSQDGVKFDNATVDVRNIDGEVIPSTVISRAPWYGQPAIVFSVPSIPLRIDPYAWRQPLYTVTITNTPQGSVPAVQTYTVRPFDVDPAPLSLGNRTFYAGRSMNVGALPTTVKLATVFTNPIVITGPATDADKTPGSVRIQNIKPNSFDIMFHEWNYLRDDKHGTEIVPFAVFESGRTSVNGKAMEAGRTTVRNNVNSNGLNWFYQAFSQPMPTVPVIAANLSSKNGTDAAVVRVRMVSKNGFYVGLQEEEKLASSAHVDETVDWVAVENGTDTGGIKASRLAVTHVPVPIAVPANSIVLASMNSTLGWDTAVPRLAVGAHDALSLYLEEEQSRDAELNHTAETLGVMTIAP